MNALDHHELSPRQFDSSLQHLIANFFSTRQESEIETLDGFTRLLSILAYELGRVDAAARLHGIGREQTLKLLREHMTAGKRSTIEQHEKDCPCDAVKMLEAELDLN